MAVQKPWSFTQNPFKNATSDSYKLAVRISTYHLAALVVKAGDPFFDELIASYTPLHNALDAAYNNWKAQGGTQQGETLQLTQLLALLSTQIKKWDITIQGVFDNTTPDYKKLLPNKRIPFQQGSQTQRIAAVSALAINLDGIVPLATLKTEVQAFEESLNNTLQAQKGNMSATKTESEAVEAARLAFCTGMYANMGALMQKYAALPEKIDQYFDLAAIRSGAQLVFTGDTKPLQHENIFKHTFQANDKLELKNEGNTSLTFYLAPQKNDIAGANTVIVPAGTAQTINVNSLGSLTNNYFNVYNPDEINKGEWTVEFV